MWHHRTRYRLPLHGFLVALVLIPFQGLTLASTGPHGAEEAIIPDAEAAYIRGRLDCGTPGRGGEIRVYDTSGNLLNLPPPKQTAPVRSSTSGAFLVEVRQVPDRVRIVALDTQCNSQRVEKLEADIRGFDPVQQIVHINPVSTLLARQPMDKRWIQTENPS